MSLSDPEPDVVPPSATLLRGAVAGGLAGALAMSALLLLLLMSLHPLVIAGPLVNPGFFGWNLGLSDVVAFLLAHILYGAVVGALLGAPRSPRIGTTADADPIPRRTLVGRR